MAQWSSRRRLKRVRVGRFKKGLSFGVFTKLQRLHVGVKVGFKISFETMCSKGHCPLFFLKIRKKPLDFKVLKSYFGGAKWWKVGIWAIFIINIIKTIDYI